MSIRFSTTESRNEINSCCGSTDCSRVRYDACTGYGCTVLDASAVLDAEDTSVSSLHKGADAASYVYGCGWAAELLEAVASGVYTTKCWEVSDGLEGRPKAISEW